MKKAEIQSLKEKVLAGGEISFEQAVELIQLQSQDEIQTLLESADEITRRFNSNEPGLCSLLNAKSYLCGEDCGVCAQSVRFDPSADRYGLMHPEKIVEAAKRAEKNGAQNWQNQAENLL